MFYTVLQRFNYNTEEYMFEVNVVSENSNFYADFFNEFSSEARTSPRWHSVVMQGMANLYERFPLHASKFHKKESSIDQKIEGCRTNIRPMKASVSAEVSLGVDWGGSEGTTWTASASGSVHDDNGNFAKVEATQNSDETGSATVSAGHEEKKD